MNYEDWCADKLAKLLNEDLRISTLNEIKDHFGDIPQNEANNIAETLQLPLVFDCLNDSNNEQIDLACEVLTLCMTNLNLGESTTRYSTALERALNHPNSAVKLMSLREICRETSAEQLLVHLNHRTELLIAIIRCIGDDDLGVAKVAIKIITSLGKMPFGIKQLLSNEFLQEFHKTMMKSDVVRLRFYEMFVDISNDCALSHRLLVSTGFIPQLLREVNNDDILLKLNIIEILSQLITSQHGYEYLESQGTMNKLIASFNSEDELFLQICQPGILKFFGTLAYWKPSEVFTNYRQIIDRIFDNISTDDYPLLGVSLDTIGLICGSVEGKLALHNLGNQFTSVLSRIWDRSSQLPTEFRVRSLNCVENVLKTTGTVSVELEIVLQSWYHALSDEPMSKLMANMTNPFGDIRTAGLGILKAIASYLWGKDVIKNTPGLTEFLLNRSIEHVKESKEIKYAIIKLLVESTVFDKHTLNRFQTYVREGPFYVEPIVEIEVEGNI